MIRFFYSKTLHTLIIMGISLIPGFIIDPYYPFSQETLLWLTSTVIQAFGAMIAIFLALGLYQLKTIYDVDDKIKSRLKELAGSTSITHSEKWPSSVSSG